MSRGELVEIGDGFRIPDLLTSGGARLREVGTTNRCTQRDYAEAIGPDTAFILKVHPSNFVISGFTASVGVAELATLGPPWSWTSDRGCSAPTHCCRTSRTRRRCSGRAPTSSPRAATSSWVGRRPA